ncbi:hypothetical protein D3C72_1121100 [compost metagenome]
MIRNKNKARPMRIITVDPDKIVAGNKKALGKICTFPILEIGSFKRYNKPMTEQIAISTLSSIVNGLAL